MDSEYRVWRKKVSLWEKRATSIEDEVKIEFLSKAVDRHKQAKRVLGHFDSSVASNYPKKC